MHSPRCCAICVLVFARFVQIADSHGFIVQPKPTETIAKGAENWYTTGTAIGCITPSFQFCTPTDPCCNHADGTLDQKYMTYPHWGFSPGLTEAEQKHVTSEMYGPIASPDPYKSNPLTQNPWFAPGRAPITGPCGTYGGQPSYILGKYQRYDATQLSYRLSSIDPSGFAWGVDGVTALLRDVMKVNETYFDPKGNPDVPHTVWKSGSTAEVAFTLRANHGGGYQYRLCKLDNLLKGTGDFNEECFQQTPLEFAGVSTTFQSGNSTISVPRVLVTDGVWPRGSTWAMNPLPACAGAGGGQQVHGVCNQAQFENALSGAGIWGWSNHAWQNSEKFANMVLDYSLVDQVKVPEGLEGMYVISWRWDCEQTPQVWTGCSLVKIEKGASLVATRTGNLRSHKASPTTVGLDKDEPSVMQDLDDIDGGAEAEGLSFRAKAVSNVGHKMEM